MGRGEGWRIFALIMCNTLRAQHVQVFGDDVGEMYQCYQIISLKSESIVLVLTTS